MICKSFLSIWGLSLNFPHTIFKEQVFLMLMKLYLTFFFSMDCAFGVVSKKFLPTPRSQRFSPMFPSRYFTVLCFTLGTTVLFELTFVFSVRYGSKFFFY